MRYKVLDLCCGLGGWSKGFYRTGGFEPAGVDIVDVGYPYRLILADVRKLDGRQFKGMDVIVASPPCRDFSKATSFGKVRWREPPNPEKGLEIVKACLRIIKEVKPEIWLLENVPQLEKYLHIPPKCYARLTKTMVRAFWGDYPPFLIPCYLSRPNLENINYPLRSWARAEIPLPVSMAFAQACKQYLQKAEEGADTG